MINEFDCALKPKAYTKIVQLGIHQKIIIKLLAVQLEDNYFHQFRYGSVRPWPIRIAILSDSLNPSHGPNHPANLRKRS